jgi:ATP-dependent RNA helicase RhlE
VSLVCVDELKLLHEIERVLGHGIPRETIEGFEPDPRIRPEPILRGGLGGTRPMSGPRGGGAQRQGAPRPGAPRPGMGPRHAPAPRHDGAVRTSGAPRPAGAPRPGTGAGRPAGAPRPGASRPPAHRGPGFAGPRRPGQGIGNGGPGRTVQPGRPIHPGRPVQPGRPNERPTGGQHRPAGPMTSLPGERLARNQGRPGN